MSKNLKISVAMIAVALAAVLVIAFASRDDTTSVTAGETSVDRLVRPDSQRLSDPADSEATFVEFLDFECEACRAAHPAVEELRATYGDRVTFVVRNMPLHNSSVDAAKAAEAAAAQGRFEDMYDKLFETQPQWGEKDSSQEAVFFALAEELGLDMDEFRRVYEDPATAAKVERDEADGIALGVSGTPTFFLDGEKLDDIRSFEDLIARIDAALAG